MRFLILSQYYTPEPVPKPAELAHALTERGHTVSVLTGFPNYPSGRTYDGFRVSPWKREQIEGINVTRTFEFPYHGKNVVGRILNYFSFMLTAPIGSLLTPAFDAIYVWHPPLTIGVSAWLIARMRRVPFVYDVQDIWPETAVVSGVLKHGWLVDLMYKLERFVYRKADHLLVVTEGARNNLMAKGIAPSKLSVMPHWVEESLFQQPRDASVRSALRRKYGWDDRFVVLFAGNIGMMQGLDTVLRAADRLRSMPRVLIVFVGDGTDKARLIQERDRMGLDIQFIDRQPADQIPGFMAGADALLVHLKRSELSQDIIPTKTLAYLAAAKPIIMAMEGASADLVSEAAAGVTVPPEDHESLAEAIESLTRTSEAELAMMGERGRQYLLNNMSKQQVISRYEEILIRVANKNGG
jgi:colanic acid biosynthesis glycosyl transferase WcaI